jgi:hypothetical protein
MPAAPPIDVTTHDFPGEKTSFNQQDVPQGSLDEGFNIAIRRPNKMEPFRGHDFLGPAMSPPPSVFAKISAGAFLGIGINGSPSAFVSFDALGLVSVVPCVQTLGNQVLGSPYPGVLPSAVPASNTVWSNGKFGLYRLDYGTGQNGVNGNGTAATAPIKPAALPPPVLTYIGGPTGAGSLIGPGISFAVTNTGLSTFTAYQSVRYYGAWKRIDTYGNVRYSELSAGVLVQFGASATNTVSFSVANGHMVTSDCVLQIYRTRTGVPIPGTTPSPTDPGTDCYLLAEFAVTPGAPGFGPQLYGFAPTDGLAGTFNTYVDKTPDNALGPPAYTNSTQPGGGIQNDATDPPRCGVLFGFANRLYYGNVEQFQDIQLSYIGGITIGDTIVINGHTYTASGTTQDASNFLVTAGANAYNNIQQTAIALVNSINAWEMGLGFVYTNALGGYNPPEARIMAQYISGAATPGLILLRRLMPGASPFTALPSNFAPWGAKPPGGIYSSDPGKQTSGIYWSVQNEPDTVPLGNSVPLGAKNNTIIGACATRDFALVATDANLWMVQELASGPSFTPFDSTVTLVSTRSMAAMSNLAYMLTNKGVLRMSNQGPEFLGDPIVEQLLNDAARPGILNTAFGIAYESESEYWLFIPNGVGDTSCSFARVYNEKTKAWTTYNALGHVVAGSELPITGTGQVKGLVFSVASGNGGVPSGPSSTWSGMLVERKALNAYDYQLPNWQVNMASYLPGQAPKLYSDTTSGRDLMVLASGNTPLKFGDILRAGNPACQTKSAVVYGVIQSSTGDQVVLFGQTQGAPNYSGNEDTLLDPATDWNVNNPNPLTVVPAVPASMRFLPFTGGEDQALTRKIWVSNASYGWFRDAPLQVIAYRWDSEYDNTTKFQMDKGPAIPQFYGNTFMGSTYASFGRASQDYINNFTIEGEHARSALLAFTLIIQQALAPWSMAYFKLQVSGALENVTFGGDY